MGRARHFFWQGLLTIAKQKCHAKFYQGSVTTSFPLKLPKAISKTVSPAAAAIQQGNKKF